MKWNLFKQMIIHSLSAWNKRWSSKCGTELKLSSHSSRTLCHFSGNGCGHTVQGTESGTLASQNYPGTYPSNAWCRWRLRVPEGRTLRLLFGDFDVESSPDCSNGSIVITDKNGEHSLGKPLRRWRPTHANQTDAAKHMLILLCQWQ